MTTEKINERIGQLRIELATLETLHDKMVKDFQAQQQIFQQKVQSNQLRFQQLQGAITELTMLLTGNEEPPNPGNDGSLVSRFLGPPDRVNPS